MLARERAYAAASSSSHAGASSSSHAGAASFDDYGDSSSRHRPSGNPELDQRFEELRGDYKAKKKLLHKKRESMRRKREEHEEQERVVAEEHARILKALRQQEEEARAALEAERQKQQDMMLEMGTLRGRLTHAAKEQAVWEQDHERALSSELEAAQQLLDQMRRDLQATHPEKARAAADEIAAMKQAVGALTDRSDPQRM